MESNTATSQQPDQQVLSVSLSPSFDKDMNKRRTRSRTPSIDLTISTAASSSDEFSLDDVNDNIVVNNQPQHEQEEPTNKKNYKFNKNNNRRRKSSNGINKRTPTNKSQNKNNQQHMTKKNKKNSPHQKKRVKLSPVQRMEIELSDQIKSQYVAMDCEMVGVGCYGQRSVLARVCIIDWYGNVIYDTYVKPSEEVTDYRTFVSGITQEHLESSDAIDFETCRQEVLATIKDKVLIGHALKNDLQALEITGNDHPWYDIRDTGKYEPFMKENPDENNGRLWPRKLKDLAKQKLQRDVQVAGISHSPIEDAQTALDLYKLVRRKWEKAMEYKINKTKEIEKLQQLPTLQEQQLAQ